MFSPIQAFSVLMMPSASEMQSAGFWLEKGNELCNSGQGQEAIKAYDHALGIDGTLIDAWNNKGLGLVQHGTSLAMPGPGKGSYGSHEDRRDPGGWERKLLQTVNYFISFLSSASFCISFSQPAIFQRILLIRPSSVRASRSVSSARPRMRRSISSVNSTLCQG